MGDIDLNFKAFAIEVAKLLDGKEKDEKTRGDGSIEGSIWAKYSGTEEANKISQSDAEKVIATDLRDNGVDFVRGVLHGMGIEWQPKVTAEPAEVSESTLHNKMIKLFDRFKNDIKEDPGIIAEILITPLGVPSPRLIKKGAKALAKEINSDSDLKTYINSHKEEVEKYAKELAQGVIFGAAAIPGGVAAGVATQNLQRR